MTSLLSPAVCSLLIAAFMVSLFGQAPGEEINPRGPARDEDVVTLQNATLTVVIGNNRSYTQEGRNHRAGYNGIFSILSTEQAEQPNESASPFVPQYSGWNLEHYFDGERQNAPERFFEPRYAPMNLRTVQENSVELYQPPSPWYQVESWTRFSLQDSHSIDIEFRCIPHRADYVGDFLGLFWASYIYAPLNKSMYFLDATASLEQPLWRQLCTQKHNLNSTVRSDVDNLNLQFDSKDALFANVSPLRYSVPFFYGRIGDMVLIYVFEEDSELRLTHSPSGGGPTAGGDDTNPAWDFQFIIPKPQKGQEYRLAGRLIFKKWQDRNDVLQEVRRYYDRGN